MSILLNLPDILKEAEKAYAGHTPSDYRVTEKYGSEDAENIVARGEALDFLSFLIQKKGMSSKVNTIYIDPPFFTKMKYEASLVLPDTGEKISVPAFEDVWSKGEEEYLKSLAETFYAMREILADDGLIWVHIDWHMSQYIRILLDEIFGSENFVNEVVWQYKSGGSNTRHFARKHDTILVYSKSQGYYFNPLKEKSYNRDFKPYRFSGVEEFEDENGWYTMVNMRDVWNIDMVGRTSSERNGYATQKPEALLRRIVESSCPEGGICADFYAGSGTLAAAAGDMGRKFISSDAGELATEISIKRLAEKGISFDVMTADEDDMTAEAVISDDAVDAGEYIKGRNIDMWSLDYDYDGAVHRARKVFTRGKDGIEGVCRRNTGQISMFDDGSFEFGKSISLVFYDITGCRSRNIF